MNNGEIKFRGINEETRKWVYGSLVNNLWTYSNLSKYKEGSACCEIITGEYEGDCWEDIAQQDGTAIISVIPDSVGQLTGLKDKSGKDIYGGDIIRIANLNRSWKHTPKIDWKIFEVKWNVYTWAFKNDVLYMPMSSYDINDGSEFDIEILGNKYENPELLKTDI